MFFQACNGLGTALTFAATPRLFLNPTVPGWLNDERRIQLPLTMGGRCTDIGVSVDDKPALAAWISDHTRFFASELPAFEFYHNENDYRSVVQPDWLQKARRRIDQTIQAYEPVASASKPLGAAFSMLKANWSEIQAALAASLFQGEAYLPAGEFYMTPQDLNLFGEPIDPDVDLFSLIRLFDTAAHVTALLKSDMIDRIVIASEEGPKDLYDAASDPTEPWIEVFDEAGGKTSIAKSELRPACVYEPDPEGNIDALRTGPANIHSAYTVFQQDLFRQISLLMGAYLLAHHRFEDGEVRGLCERILPLRPRGEDLFLSTGPDIVRSHMKATGRKLGDGLDELREDIMPLRFLVRALLWIGSLS